MKRKNAGGLMRQTDRLELEKEERNRFLTTIQQHNGGCPAKPQNHKAHAHQLAVDL